MRVLYCSQESDRIKMWSTGPDGLPQSEGFCRDHGGVVAVAMAYGFGRIIWSDGRVAQMGSFNL